ncbi:MAG: PP2C family protein-serine/threonine phosphatase [Candidatus Omnitrophota bacterium]
MNKRNFDYYVASFQGRREKNEDCALFNTNPNKNKQQTVLAVADGMGGYENGEIASKMMIDYLKKLCDHDIPLQFKSVAETVRAYIQEANHHIFEVSKKLNVNQMGTTVSGAFIIGNLCLFFNVGDSRTYILNSNEIRQVTRDHSADQEAFDNGIIKEDEIGKGFYSNTLTRSIGTDEHVEIDIFPQDNFYELNEGDVIVSCSDGLWNNMDLMEIHRQTIGRSSLNESLEALASLAYANDSNDNISIVAFEYGQLPRKDLNLGPYVPLTNLKPKFPPKKKMLITLLIFSILGFLAVVLMIPYKKHSNTKTITETITKTIPKPSPRTYVPKKDVKSVKVENSKSAGTTTTAASRTVIQTNNVKVETIHNDKCKLLDLETRRNIFKNTRMIEIDVPGVDTVFNKGKYVIIRLLISASGKAKVAHIAKLGVNPERKLPAVKTKLGNKIESMTYLPPTSEQQPVNVNLSFDIYYKEKIGNKIFFQRKEK